MRKSKDLKKEPQFFTETHRCSIVLIKVPQTNRTISVCVCGVWRCACVCVWVSCECVCVWCVVVYLCVYECPVSACVCGVWQLPVCVCECPVRVCVCGVLRCACMCSSVLWVCVCVVCGGVPVYGRVSCECVCVWCVVVCLCMVSFFSHVWLCDAMNCSMPGFPVLHYLPEFAQIQVHWVSDTI